jgi:hypothetical protein
LGSNPGISQKSQMGDISKGRSGQNTLYPAKKRKKNITVYGSFLLVNHIKFVKNHCALRKSRWLCTLGWIIQSNNFSRIQQRDFHRKYTLLDRLKVFRHRKGVYTFSNPFVLNVFNVGHPAEA